MSGLYIVFKQIKRKWQMFFMDACSYLSVADSYGSHSRHVVALKFICNKNVKTLNNWNYFKNRLTAGPVKKNK